MQECLELERTGALKGFEVRARKRELETDFGRARLWRNGWKGEGEEHARFPLDEQLELPAKIYSEPLKERVADGARSGSWDHVVEQLDKTTAGHMPKRQLSRSPSRSREISTTSGAVPVGGSRELARRLPRARRSRGRRHDGALRPLRLPSDYWSRFVATIAAVDTTTGRARSTGPFLPEKLIVVVVDAQAIEPALAKLPVRIERAPEALTD